MRLKNSTFAGSRFAFGAAIAAAVILWIVASLFAEPPVKSKTAAKTESTKKIDDSKRVTLDVARDRAKLTHNIYSATLDVMHERYFRSDRATVPARAMQDVFKEISEQEGIKANWIAVNSRAMSIDHEPKGKFEKQAAKALAGEKQTYERVENGVYKRAERISLMNRGCLGCHLGFGATGTKKRFAGLVISIPVKKQTVKK